MVLEKRVRFGDEVDLRHWQDKYLTLSVKIRPTWRGRLRKFLYKPPAVQIWVRTAADSAANSNPEPSIYNFIPAMPRAASS